MTSAAKTQLLCELREQTQRIAQSARRPYKTGLISSGWLPLDRLLPAGGFEGGTLVDWLAQGLGSGATALALRAAAAALEGGGACVVIDQSQKFYPPAAAELGLPLERMILIRPPGPRLTLWAWEQCLRFRGVAVTLGEMGPLTDRPFRRLQLAVEAGGGLGFLLRPAACRHEPSWADIRLAVSTMASSDLNRRWRVETLHNSAIVELSLSPRATPMTADRKIRSA
jgi:hypothetical protein